MPDGVFKYQTKAGPRWGVRLKYKGEDGIWRATTIRKFPKEYLAVRELATLREARDRKKLFRGGRAEHQSVRDYFEHWLRTYAAPSCKYSTYTSYVRVINRYLLPVAGHLPLHSLNVQDLRLVLEAAQGKRRQTLRNIFTPIREGLSHAVAEGLLPANPALALAPHFRQIRDPRRKVQPFTHQETRTLLHAAARHSATIHVALLLAVRAGLRASEILGLQWPDLDLPNKTATIRHARVWRRDTTTKNHRMRIVHLTAGVVQALTALPRHPRSPLVLQRNGQAVTQDWLTYTYRHVLTAAGLPRRRVHDLRHTYVSHLIALGASPKYIQDQAGHSTIAVTFDIYGHLFDVERFADRLEGKKAQ